MNKIELVKDFYGFTTKEAKNYLKDASENQIKEIQSYYINNSKKVFTMINKQKRESKKGFFFYAYL